MTGTVAAYWWNTRRNYGDFLAPLVLQHMADLEAKWTPIAEADWIVVGSVLDLVPPEWDGTILGAGLLRSESRPDLSGARVLGVRGHLTANLLGLRHVALGDPGLLCSEFIPEPEKTFNLTVVPHWSDRDLARRFAHLNPHVIDPSSDTEQVIRDIAASKKVVASSLHGIIIADSYRIPRRAEKFPQMYASYEGGEFKFHDYASALHEQMQFGVLHTPKEQHIERAQAELFEAFSSIRRKRPRRPWSKFW